MFNEHYSLTDNSGQKSVFEPFSKTLNAALVAGVYNNGLLTIVDDVTSRSLLKAWSWLLGNTFRPLITTGLGDVFISDSTGISFLDVQRGTVEFIDTELEWFINDFLVQPEIVDQVLKLRKLEELVNSRRPLKYHEVFILEPWLKLGGVDIVDNHIIGKCDVYLDLVGQSFY